MAFYFAITTRVFGSELDICRAIIGRYQAMSRRQAGAAFAVIHVDWKLNESSSGFEEGPVVYLA